MRHPGLKLFRHGPLDLLPVLANPLRRQFPKLKIFGWVVLVTQLECLIVVPITFGRDPRTADMINMKDQLDADGNEVYPVPGYFVLTAIPLILLSWCLKDFVDAVWCLGQIFLARVSFRA